MHTMDLSEFLKQRRQSTRLTQQDLADKAGVGLRFIREMEQGKATLRLDKVNQVLRLFGHEMLPAPMDREKLLNPNILKKRFSKQ
jgi:y4mF family transcriptional regulator